MGRITKLTVSALVGTTLVLGIGGGVASAVTGPTTGVTVTTPPSSSSAHVNVFTGPQIWRIVRPHQVVYCKQASRKLHRIHSAMNAAARRLSQGQITQSRVQTRSGPKAQKRGRRLSTKAREFQKLEHDGQALVNRIEAKCHVSAPST
jgi:hypothetical protein